MTIEKRIDGIDFTIDTGAQSVDFDVASTKGETGVKLFRLKASFTAATSPEKISVTFYVKKDDAATTFKPNEILNAGIRPDWNPSPSFSSAACGAPVIAAVTKNDKNKVTVALFDCKTPCALSLGFNEPRQKLTVRVELFTALVSPIKEYETELRVDFRDETADKTIADVRGWWKNFYRSAYLPEAAELPCYAPWYVFQQRFTDETLIEQCRLAKALGMETIIVDDGWQTEDNGGGYSYCGDWRVCKSKIADMAEFVKSVHAIGMKVMLWFSVPYMGKNAKAADDFRGKYLYFDGGIGAYALDPRFSKVREYLTGIYAEFLNKYDLDGFKLDFIDAFYLTADSPKNYDDMDYVSLSDAVEALIGEVTDELRRIKPDVMLEFRQRYTGAVMQQFGNMFRVGDCAGDENTLKTCVADLRMLTSGVAVHSDPLIWSYDDAVEYAAYQLNHSIFGVPQISLNLKNITDEHRRMLAYYLAYFRENRKTLLNGRLRAEGFSHGYTALTATGEEKDVTALYGTSIVDFPGDKSLDVINAASERTVYIRVKRETKVAIKITDCKGEVVSERTVKLSAGLNEIDVPVSGFAFIRLQK